MVVLDSVTDVKDRMSDQTPLLHDHLKAQQFKFQRNESRYHEYLKFSRLMHYNYFHLYQYKFRPVTDFGVLFKHYQ